MSALDGMEKVDVNGGGSAVGVHQLTRWPRAARTDADTYFTEDLMAPYRVLRSWAGSAYTVEGLAARLAGRAQSLGGHNDGVRLSGPERITSLCITRSHTHTHTHT